MPGRGLFNTEHPLDYFLNVHLLEGTELVDSERSEAQQRLFRAAQDRVGVSFGLVVRAEQDYFLVLDVPCHEMQQLERRCVSPLEILEHDEERLLR